MKGSFNSRLEERTGRIVPNSLRERMRMSLSRELPRESRNRLGQRPRDRPPRPHHAKTFGPPAPLNPLLVKAVESLADAMFQRDYAETRKRGAQLD